MLLNKPNQTKQTIIVTKKLVNKITKKMQPRWLRLSTTPNAYQQKGKNHSSRVLDKILKI